jgi:hypothetical protein
MAVETKYSTRFTSGVPTNGRVTRSPSGLSADIGFITDLALDDVGDFNAFVPVPIGAQILRLEWDTPDLDTHATPTADLDPTLRTWDKDGNAVDTQLLNAGTLFQAASKTYLHLDRTKVPESSKGYGIVGLKVVAAAATAGTGAGSMLVEWH